MPIAAPNRPTVIPLKARMPSPAMLNRPATLPRIEPVSQSAHGDGEEQKRQPMRQHREAGERRRIEFLEHHPIADHVLDVVGHHGQHEGHELKAIRW